MTTTAAANDDAWAMIEEAVYRLFDDFGALDHVAVGPRLAELGWAEIEAEYPVESDELLFRAQGRALSTTDCLDRVMLAELRPVLGTTVDLVVFPHPKDGFRPRSRTEITGVIQGPGHGVAAVPVLLEDGSVGVTTVDVDRLDRRRLDTFDPTVHWTEVRSVLPGDVVPADGAWARAVAAAHRAQATELIALADRALQLTVEHARARVQFGSPIGSFQAPRHALADVAAALECARSGLWQSWRYGGSMSAMAAKATAGRTHRALSDAAMQVCGAIGVTAEHDLHRYVRRGFQIEGLCGTLQHLETALTESIFDDSEADEPLAAITAWV